MKTIKEIQEEISQVKCDLRANDSERFILDNKLRKLELDLNDHPDTPPYGLRLFGGNPNCKHHVVKANGGGVKCTKCGAWCCA